MADINENWVLYNTGKAYKNWQEYLFDWTMLSEYNTLQQQYADYQASIDSIQADLKTSIEGKWVTVPTTAKLDEYPWYIDQIQQRIGSFNWVKLYSNRVTSNNCTPATTNVISWEDNWKLYWLVATTTEDSNTNYYFWIYTFKKVTSGDIQYAFSENSTRQNASYTHPTTHREVYKSADKIRVFTFTDWDWSWQSSSYRRSYCYQFDWDTSTWSITNTYLWQWAYQDHNYADYWWSTAWYTHVFGTTWVQSAVWERINNNGYIYLTLK